MTEAAKDISTQAVSTQTEQFFRTDFELDRELPVELKDLEAISRNFYWSWQPDGVSLFRDLDPRLWDRCEQNPRLLLKKLRDVRMWQKAADPAYRERLRHFAERLWMYASSTIEPKDARVAYFCAEYGVHNSLPNYSGGLGILAGDHLKSASDLNVPLVAIGLLYRFGYFRQRIEHDGWQKESYNDIFQSELALTPVVDDSGDGVTVTVH